MSPRVISERLVGTPEQVRIARRLVADALGEKHPCRDDAILLTSEIATNAVQHSRTADAGGKFTLIVEWTETWVRITVRDNGSDSLPCWCRARADATNGRGIDMLNQLSVRWGFCRERAGLQVWFELDADFAELLIGAA